MKINLLCYCVFVAALTHAHSYPSQDIYNPVYMELEENFPPTEPAQEPGK